MAEKSPNLTTNVNLQIHKAKQIPNIINSKKSRPRHIINNYPKIKTLETS